MDLNTVPLQPLPNTCIYSFFLSFFLSIYIYIFIFNANKYVCVYMLIFLLQKWAAGMPRKIGLLEAHLGSSILELLR